MTPQPFEHVIFQTLSTLCESLGYDFHLVLVNVTDPDDRHWAASDALSSLELVAGFSKGSRLTPIDPALSNAAIPRGWVGTGYDEAEYTGASEDLTCGSGELGVVVKREADGSVEDFVPLPQKTMRPYALSKNQVRRLTSAKNLSRLPGSNPSKPVGKKRPRLSLQQKLEILGFIDAGNPLSKAAEHFGYTLSTMNQIWRCRKEIKRTCQTGVNLKRKLVRDSPYQQLEVPLIEWCKKMKEEGAFINGPMVQDEALKIADRLEMKQFTASNGWLSRFLARNDIKFKSADVTPVELLGPFEKGQVEGAKSVANQILNAS